MTTLFLLQTTMNLAMEINYSAVNCSVAEQNPEDNITVRTFLQAGCLSCLSNNSVKALK